MMLGMREEFNYFECDHCCCLSLLNPPDDMSLFYPPDKYYSFRESQSISVSRNPVRTWIKHVRDRALCFDRQGLPGLISRWYPNQDALDCRGWIRHTSLRSHRARILDVGCGHGWHLSLLHRLGFTNLTGVDPYLPEDIVFGPVRIHASPIPVLFGRVFDFIMLHHSLEHMPNQVEVLTQIRRLLAPNGECLVRIPIVSRGPWRTYGADWAEIDAPRHFVLHSEMSLKIAAEKAGLAIKCIQYESESFSYATSELYRRNLSLYDDDTKRHRQPASVFDASELQQFELMSRSHHIPGWAGRAAFFLTPHSSPSKNISVFAG